MSSPRSARRRVLAAVLAGACLLAADFSRPDPASFALGRTTEPEIRQRFGAPEAEATGLVGDQSVRVLRYTYSTMVANAVAARAMVYTFSGGRLVGFDYSSSFPADQTGFDEAAAKRITRGQTTRAESRALLGNPTGQFIYPSAYAPMPGRRADVYSYTRTERTSAGTTLDQVSRVLALVFDERDVVVETSLVTTSTSRPLP
ncbi:MAG TPA: hypothetical protein VIA61_15590 [Methylomirabilota bacterium]|jgi:hypothetical protein